MHNSIKYAIETLIAKRSEALGLSRSELVRRAGFMNIPKGLRRLDELFAGELKTTASLIAGLPSALDLPREVINDALRETESQLEEARQVAEYAREAAWRASFQPSAFLLGTATRPTQIVIYGITGGSERWLRIPLDTSQPPVTFASQALAVVRRTPFVPFFGATTGFVVNYAPDCAVRFDLKGSPVERLDHAYRTGPVIVTIGRRRFRAEALGTAMGLIPRQI